MTVVRGRNDELPQNEGRHNTICVMIYFASIDNPDPEPSHDINFKNCKIEGVDRFLIYNPNDLLQSGTVLTEISLDQVTFTNLVVPSFVCALEEEPLTIHLKDVASVSVDDSSPAVAIFDGTDPNTKLNFIS